MLSRIRKRMKGEKGFTLIELLVVIIIIAILAAIAIPTFLGQRSKAQDAAAESLVRNAMTAMETTYVDNQTFVGAVTGTPSPVGAVEPSITFTADAADAATASTADCAANTVSVSGLTATAYHVGTLSKSGKVIGVAVDKTAGVTYYKDGASTGKHW